MEEAICHATVMQWCCDCWLHDHRMEILNSLCLCSVSRFNLKHRHSWFRFWGINILGINMLPSPSPVIHKHFLFSWPHMCDHILHSSRRFHNPALQCLVTINLWHWVTNLSNDICDNINILRDTVTNDKSKNWHQL